jgi:hypothetical protein
MEMVVAYLYFMLSHYFGAVKQFQQKRQLYHCLFIFHTIVSSFFHLCTGMRGMETQQAILIPSGVIIFIVD